MSPDDCAAINGPLPLNHFVIAYAQMRSIVFVRDCTRRTQGSPLREDLQPAVGMILVIIRH
jgi:hypothetical protein